MMYNAIGNGRFSQMMIRLLWMKIGGSSAPTLAPEIAPSLDVNQMDDPAMPFLRNEKLVTGYGIGSPSAGQYTSIALQNPAGSGVLLILKGLDYWTDVVGFLPTWYFINAVNAAQQFNSYAADSRWGTGAKSLARPVCGWTNGAQATNPATIAADALRREIYSVAFSGGVYREMPLVLRPGTELRLVHGTITTPTINVNANWIERPVNQEELVNA